MEGTRSQLGAFPASGQEGREKKLFYRLRETDGIKMVSGERTPALISVWASNDVIQFGTEKILAGGAVPQQTDWDSHPGDACFYVLDGPVTFFTEDKQTFHVETGDYFILPENTKYKIINYYGHTVKVLFMIAPKF
ncbi:MAG: cupin domain-containing protein [Blautia sp.]|nr:cupin domain-containing protein [Blautia sp.]